MQDCDDTNVRKLLVVYWVHHNEVTCPETDSTARLRHIANHLNIRLRNAVFQKATEQLESLWAHGDIRQWMVSISFRAHPYFVWNVICDAVALAKTDDHLREIANGPAMILLAYCGSMVSDFEETAGVAPKFRRMLTGVWRHRMCDDVWHRLRALQSEVPDPITNMARLEKSPEYWAERLSAKDRATADKGLFVRDAAGDWQKKHTHAG